MLKGHIAGNTAVVGCLSCVISAEAMTNRTIFLVFRQIIAVKLIKENANDSYKLMCVCIYVCACVCTGTSATYQYTQRYLESAVGFCPAI